MFSNCELEKSEETIYAIYNFLRSKLFCNRMTLELLDFMFFRELFSKDHGITSAKVWFLNPYI